ncbi:MAG TPA: GDSL-type esterase/lipase family protein [bacterium]|nr:GDSL-type esterase/lipase family protein [bacterium]
MSGRLRSLLVNAAVVAVTLLVLAPAAELAVRLIRPQPLPSQEFIQGFVLKDMYVDDDRAGYRLAPDFSGRIERGAVVTEFSTNSLGLRGPEPGPKSALRVLALGDSYTFGWGVAQGEEWIRVAADEVNRKLGREAVEGWNGGVNGYGTEGAIAQLERVADELQPDLVVLGFFANDFTDNLLGTGVYEVRDGYLFDRFSHDFFQESVLARESHLYRLVSSAWETARLKYLGGVPTARAVKQFSPAEFERGRDRSEELILRLRDVAEGAGAALAVVWLPADVYAVSGSAPQDVPLRWELQRRIAAAGVPSLDLLPVALAETRIAGLYIPNDGHLSVRGNRVMGRAVAAWLLESDLLPEPAPPR